MKYRILSLVLAATVLSLQAFSQIDSMKRQQQSPERNIKAVKKVVKPIKKDTPASPNTPSNPNGEAKPNTPQEKVPVNAPRPKPTYTPGKTSNANPPGKG